MSFLEGSRGEKRRKINAWPDSEVVKKAEKNFVSFFSLFSFSVSLCGSFFPAFHVIFFNRFFELAVENLGRFSDWMLNLRGEIFVFLGPVSDDFFVRFDPIGEACDRHIGAFGDGLGDGS